MFVSSVEPVKSFHRFLDESIGVNATLPVADGNDASGKSMKPIVG